MAKTGGPRLRGMLRDIHLWIGLCLFLVLAPLGLSGSLLVWDEPLDRAIHPERYRVTAGALAPSAYVVSAQRAFNGRAIPAQVRMPAGPGEPVIVTGFVPGRARPGERPPSLTAWIDPGAARTLDVGDPRGELRGVVHRLHGALLAPQYGRTIVGWLGVAMLVSCVSGLVVWWPRNNAFVRALAWRRSPSTLSNLHHAAGFWICVPLAVLSLTGAWIAFPEATRALTSAFQNRPAGPPDDRRREVQAPAAPLGDPRLSVDQAVAAAVQASGGGARLVSVTLPTRGGRPAWRVQLRPAAGPAATVRVDDATGQARLQPQDGGDPVARFMRRLHEGSDFGPVWRVIVTLAGVAPTVLGVSGVLLWLDRRRARSRAS
ncbi:MAG: PepSY-associated TM helix domain-containing protein [Caulobacteraceae bacterium]|nr:PepSY-associated TM helix domain-containing protein [Caulobacteraceae bacterium]